MLSLREKLRKAIGKKVEVFMSKLLEKWWCSALGSWKTTTLGALVLVSVLVVEGVRLIDGDPETVADLEALLVALSVFFGLSFARDDGE